MVVVVALIDRSQLPFSHFCNVCLAQSVCVRITGQGFDCAFVPTSSDTRNKQHNPAINNDTSQGFGQCFAGLSVDILVSG